MSKCPLILWYCDIVHYYVYIKMCNITCKGGAVAQSVERSTPGGGGGGSSTPGEQVSGSIPAVAACSLLVGSVSV